ncbi:MAG TPA: GDP-mannose 4,6-dehydratase, partial [Chloroflexota bacterium]|nr:GDP-mannose 4,6-dehydratase [Chloroflexota bacterium]
AVGQYRQQHGVFVCSAIMFNHESPRRGESFVTRKITRAVARIKLGQQSELLLGNLDAVRDWGFAGDYVRALHLMIQREVPDDYVVGTGEAHTIRDFLDVAFGHADLDWRDFVKVDPRFYRPAEDVPLVADPRKARATLGWQPSVSFEELVREMVDADLALERGR